MSPFPVSSSPFVGLLIVMTVKHYVADFVLQTNWMARGKEQAVGWAPPLIAHCLCHGVLTLAVVLAVRPSLWWLAAVDFAVHIVIDRFKTLIGLRMRWTPAQAFFWWLLGFDQCLHQLTAIGISVAICVL